MDSSERVERRGVRVLDLEVSYRVAGEDPPIVLVHGDGDSSATWQAVIPPLAREHRVYAPDLPRSGESDKPTLEYAPEFFERVLAAFLERLDLERVVLAGNSLGGLAALRLALHRPELGASLVLIDSAGPGREISPITRAGERSNGRSTDGKVAEHA